MKNKAYLLIGGNIGDREGCLSAAKREIETRCGRTAAASAIYQTAAWGLENQEDFLNQVIEIETALSAPELLQTILQIEESLGRKREEKYGPRLIDIDILFYNEEVIKTEGLSVPHPQLQNRRFVLVPLTELAPDKFHPLLHKFVGQLLAECTDPLPVQKFK